MDIRVILIGMLISLSLFISRLYATTINQVEMSQDRLDINEKYMIKGVVADETGILLSGVNILLYTGNDMIHYNKGVVSNQNGEFKFMDLVKGSYRIVTSMIGFESQEVTVILDKESIVLDTLRMKEAINPLEEIVVVSNNLEVLGEKNVKHFSKREREKSATALDLMTNIPQIKIDASTNKLVNKKAQSILILCNGIKANELDLLGLRPEDIQKAEYFPEPPVKYLHSGYESVLMVTTRQAKEKGGYITANLENSFMAGFGTDVLQGRYSSGENDYTLRYFIDYRNLDKNRFSQSYKYTLNGDKEYNLEKNGQNGNYTGQYHKIQASYSRNKNDNYLFVSKATLSVNPGSENYPQLSSGIEAGKAITEDLSHLFVKTHYLSPSLDLYFSKQMKNEQEISFNIVNTYYDSKSDRSLKGDNYNIVTRLDNQSYSLIMEGEYEKRFQSDNMLSAGIRYFYKTLDEQYRMNEDGEKQNHNLSHNIYMYADWSGRKGKLIYTLGMGAEENIQQTDTRLSSFILKPMLSLTYKMNKVSSLKLRSSLSAYSPNISLLTNSPVYIEPTILSIGNPNLKSYYKVVNHLLYNYNRPGLFMEIAAYYDYARHPYYPIYENKGSYIQKRYDNISNAQQAMGQIYLSWNPFDFLNAACYYEAAYQSSSINHSIYKHWHHFVNMSLSASYKDFTLEGMVILKNKGLNGMLLEKDNNYYSATLSWKKKSLTLSLTTLFMHDPHISETVSGSAVYYRETKAWNNFKGLTYLRIAYTLPFGKSIKRSMKQRLNNTDMDSGIFIDSKTKM